MTGPQQPAANQRGKYTPSFPAARMWRGAGAGLVLGCLLIWSWVINDIPRAALNPAGAGLGWAGLGWDGLGWDGMDRGT